MPRCKRHQGGILRDVARSLGELGQRSSISLRISSAQRTASEMAATVAGTRLPPSYCASLRAARILAAINNTRLRPSSTIACYTFRLWFAIEFKLCRCCCPEDAAVTREPDAKALPTWSQRLFSTCETPEPTQTPSGSQIPAEGASPMGRASYSHPWEDELSLKSRLRSMEHEKEHHHG